MPEYINKSCVQNFKTFKYSGGNDSITYSLIWSPLADKLLDFVPTNIAPNTITFTSLILLAITHILFVFAGSNENGVAVWKSVLMAITIFVYQNLDNLDGKQARKTNSSSPLGMLFDHGTDAVASFLISVQVTDLLDLQEPTYRIGVIFVYTMLTFFSAMWSQYGTGFFRLGQINPVDEGLPGYALTAILCIFLPEGFWSRSDILGKNNQLLLVILAVLLVSIIYHMVKDIFKQAVRPKDDILHVLYLPASYTVGLFTVWLFCQNLQPICIPLVYVLMFTWSRNMIQLQLCFVTKQRFQPFNFGTLSFLVICLVLVGFDQFGVGLGQYMWIGVVATGAIFFEFVSSVLRQGSSLLGIKVFSLQKSRTQ